MLRVLGVTFALLFAGGIARADEPVAPTRAALDRAVRQHVDPHADADACLPAVTVGSELHFECHRTDCPGNCQVVHVITVLAFRGGRFRRVSQREESRGDTGECGCCLTDDL